MPTGSGKVLCPGPHVPGTPSLRREALPGGGVGVRLLSVGLQPVRSRGHSASGLGSETRPRPQGQGAVGPHQQGDSCLFFSLSPFFLKETLFPLHQEERTCGSGNNHHLHFEGLHFIKPIMFPFLKTVSNFAFDEKFKKSL